MDRIRLEAIRAYGRHGAEPSERERPQAFDVSVTLELDLERARRSDDLRHTIDYAQLHERIVAIVGGTSFALIERLAGEILDAALADDRVARAAVTVAKPEILAGATPSVTLARERRP
ncbi:MAG TPA: dihydroneopterin aldolase [Candidatus Tumulicola sp.]|nr:dihydroneopterin aldolase [Candidatus Tumulicola sp.]